MQSGWQHQLKRGLLSTMRRVWYSASRFLCGSLASDMSFEVGITTGQVGQRKRMVALMSSMFAVKYLAQHSLQR
jgi:hypothetical protein